MHQALGPVYRPVHADGKHVQAVCLYRAVKAASSKLCTAAVGHLLWGIYYTWNKVMLTSGTSAHQNLVGDCREGPAVR